MHGPASVSASVLRVRVPSWLCVRPAVGSNATRTQRTRMHRVSFMDPRQALTILLRIRSARRGWASDFTAYNAMRILPAETPPIGNFILLETLVLAGVRFLRRCHYRRQCHSV